MKINLYKLYFLSLHFFTIKPNTMRENKITPLVMFFIYCYIDGGGRSSFNMEDLQSRGPKWKTLLIFPISTKI